MALESAIWVIICGRSDAPAPDPFGKDSLPPDVKECTATVIPICTERSGNRYGSHIDRTELQELCEDEDIGTRAVAKALFALPETPVTVSPQECEDAYYALDFAQKQWYSTGLTVEEIQKIIDMRWYESKESVEILKFQLYAENYMSLEKLQEILGGAFGKEIEEEEI